MLELVEVDSLKRVVQVRNLLMPVQNSKEVEVRARVEATLTTPKNPRVLALHDGVPVAFLAATKSFEPRERDQVPIELVASRWVFIKMIVVGVDSRGHAYGATAMSQFLHSATAAWGAEIAGLRVDGTPPVERRTEAFVKMGFTATGSPSRFAYKRLAS